MKNTIRIIGIILVLFTLASSFTIFFGDHSSKKNGNTTTTNEHITKPYSDVTYVAFGDSINDIYMIHTAGVGVAVENARDELKEVADYICPSNDNDGVAEVIEMIMDGSFDFVK